MKTSGPSESLVPVRFPGSRPLLDRGVILAGITSYAGTYPFNWVTAPHHRVLYTVKGRCRLDLIDDSRLLLPEHLWVVPAGTRHRLRIGPGSWSVMWFHLRNGEPWTNLRGQSVHRRFEGQAERIVHIMAGLIAEAHSPCEDRVEMGRHFAEILGIFLERRLHIFGDARDNRLRQQLALLWESVDADLSRNWTIASLSRLMHVSPPHFHRLVRRYNQTTPLEFLTRLRLQRAEDLLANTDLKLEAIAMQVGYGSGFALSKAFKKRTGLSPRSYRQKHYAVSPPAK